MTVTRSRGQLIAIALAIGLTVPGLTVRFSGAHLTPWIAALVYGIAVVGSAFVLAWAAEALQLDVSQGLAIAVLALIAVLPEYAVDFVFTWKAGKNPHEFAPLALANMTGGNRLLIGVGWSLVVLLAAWRMRRIGAAEGYEGPYDDEVNLARSHSIEIGFLAVATVYSLTLPLKRTINMFDAVVLVCLFVAYMIRVARAPAQEPHLVGPAQLIGSFPKRQRRTLVGVLLAFAAGVILACAEGFAESLVETGTQFGVSKFLLVQWLAPLASEAPELLVAGLFAWRLNTEAGLGALVSSKVNQWTLLVGTLPIVFAVSSHSLHGLPLDALQREELFLTAAQSAFAVAVLANRSISVREAVALLTLFLSQFVLGAVLPEGIREVERIGVGIIYLILAAVIIFRQRSAVRPLLRDGFRTPAADLVHA
ncbi:MAG: sodium:proton exchanger, partial [Acidimicrobiia bacterium]